MILILDKIKISKDERIFIVQKIKMIKNKFTLQAAPGPVTALASFPGSGNTWLRYLLQQVDDNDNHDDDPDDNCYRMILFLLVVNDIRFTLQALNQGGRSCTGARVAPAEKFGLGQKF